jgi:hypothetical protein
LLEVSAKDSESIRKIVRAKCSSVMSKVRDLTWLSVSIRRNTIRFADCLLYQIAKKLAVRHIMVENKRTRGVTIVEYAIMLALIAIAIAVAAPV